MRRLPLLLASVGLATTLTAGPAGSVAPGPVTVHDSTTRVALLDNPVTPRQHARVRVTVTLEGGSAPTGEIRLVVDGQRVGTKLLRGARDDGSRVFTLDRLAPGRHAVKAVFGGNYDAASSSSGVKHLRVARERRTTGPA